MQPDGCCLRDGVGDFRGRRFERSCLHHFWWGVVVCGGGRGERWGVPVGGTAVHGSWFAGKLSSRSTDLKQRECRGYPHYGSTALLQFIREHVAGGGQLSG